MAEIKSELSMKIEALTRKKLAGGNIDEGEITTLNDTIKGINPNTTVEKPLTSFKAKKDGNIVINVSTYDTLTKLKNMDGKDYNTMLVYLLELHLMGDLGRISSLNIDKETKNKLIENLNSFNKIMGEILKGSD